jgi:HEAT repeat protein
MSLTLTERQTIWDTFCRTLTSDINPSVRAKAAEALGKLIDPKFAPNLLAALADPSPLVRQSAIQALGQIGATEAIPALIDALSDPIPEVSAAAANSLGQLRAEQAISALLTELTNPALIVAHSSISALGNISSPIAVKALLAAFLIAFKKTNDIGNSLNNFDTANIIIDALATIGAKNPTSIDTIRTTAKQIIANSDNNQLRQSAVKLLGKIAPVDSVPDIIALLQDSDPNVVQAAIEALGNALSGNAAA